MLLKQPSTNGFDLRLKSNQKPCLSQPLLGKAYLWWQFSKHSSAGIYSYLYIYIRASLEEYTLTLKLYKAQLLNVPFHPFATDILLQCHLQRNVALCCLLGWLLCKLALLWNFAYTNNLKKIIIFRYKKLKLFLQCVISVKTLFKRTQQCTAALDNIVSVFRLTITLMSVHN